MQDFQIVEPSDIGIPIPVGLAATYTYSSGNMTTATVSYKGYTFVKTFTWSGNDMTAETLWVKT